MGNWCAYVARWPYGVLVALTVLFLWLVALLLLPAPPLRHGQALPQNEALSPAPQTQSAAMPAVGQQLIAGAEDHVPLSPAPDPAVTEETASGPLPVMADDGRKPWQVYARSFAVGSTPRVAVVVVDLGGDRMVANAAIERLPGTVTLAIDAQAADVGEWLRRARAAGHETVLNLPAEPIDYPASDPGSRSLLTELSGQENIRRLLGFLKAGTGYIGVTTLSGTGFVVQPRALQPVIDEIQRRGLALLDARTAPRSVMSNLAAQRKVPFALADFRLGADLSPAALDQVLLQAQRQALQAGQAVCVVMATPLAIDRLNRWLATLPQAGIRLAPLSAMLK